MFAQLCPLDLFVPKMALDINSLRYMENIPAVSGLSFLVSLPVCAHKHGKLNGRTCN